MPLEIIGSTLDHRTGTRVFYAQADIDTYMKMIGDNFDEFEIQRRRVKHKAYPRMKDDIIAGALLPTITLAAKKDFIDDVYQLEERQVIAEKLSVSGCVNILDGLQRTHIISDIIREGHDLKETQKLLLEIWLETDVRNLIYRIIILNSGQKPMSIRHQIELLFSSVRERLLETIQGLDILSERGAQRRVRSRKYAFVTLSLSYYAYIMKTPEVDKDNIVAQKIQEDDILSGGDVLFGSLFDRFTNLLEKFCEIDDLVVSIYPDEGLAWIGSENVMLSFFAAASSFDARHDGTRRVDVAIDRLIHDLRNPVGEMDPLSLESYRSVIGGFNTRKVNVGYATRKLLMNAFKEYFRAEGEVQFRNLWPQEAD